MVPGLEEVYTSSDRIPVVIGAPEGAAGSLEGVGATASYLIAQQSKPGIPDNVYHHLDVKGEQMNG